MIFMCLIIYFKGVSVSVQIFTFLPLPLMLAEAYKEVSQLMKDFSDSADDFGILKPQFAK